jgi:DNA-directed RNA polymerase specialized sigma24 family protein
MRSRQVIDQDAELARRCVAGDQQAWKLLYHSHYERLVAVIALQLGAAGRDLSQAEEVASQVWLSLWENSRRRFRAFDANRASLKGFLWARARQQACYYLRRQARLALRQAPWPARSPAAPAPPLLPQGPAWDEFCAALTAQELRLVRDRLKPANPGEAPRAPLSAAERKLKQRVLAKLRIFLRRDAA